MHAVRFLGALAAGTALAVTLAHPAGAAPRQYRASDLGTLPGGSLSEATAVNDHGQVVGLSDGSPHGIHAVLWQHGTITDLTPDTGFSSAADVNEAGQVLVFVNGSAAVWDRGTLTAIPEVLSPGAIDEHGDVAGETVAGDAVVRWHDGTVQLFGPGFAAGLNDRGQVAGWSFGDSGNQQATLWQDGQRIALAPEPSVANAVNERGQVSGVGVKDGVRQAFRWQDGQLTWLGEIGQVEGTPQRINNLGHVLGVRQGGQYLWRNGVMTDLASLLGPGRPRDLNDRDEFVGDMTSGTRTHAVLWR